MPDDKTLSELLEPGLPGTWIAENRRIWQMDFLSADKLARFGHDRGLAFFSEKDIVQLWQLGLIKADLITSEKKLRLVGLVYRDIDKYGRHMYSDERQLPRRRKGWENARKNLKPLQKGVELQFHPFRYYVLYGIDHMIKLTASSMQIFLQKNYLSLLEFCLTRFNHFANSDNFITSINTWNNVATLCIVTEPYAYQYIFHSIKYDITDVQSHQAGREEIIDHIADYWHNNVEKLYLQIGLDQLEEIRKGFGFDIKSLDPNEWVHTLVCLGDNKLRLELEGHLGGAVLLRTMAEMLRRASEEAFHTELPEEDELGFGRMKHIKETLYGSSRLLDNHKAGSEFARWHGLNYKPRVHFYCEGETEYGAISHFFKIIGITVPITNLHGLMKLKNEKYQMLTFVKDSLEDDIKNHIYSIVVIDGDLVDNVRVIANRARINQTSPNEGMFGRFFLAEPDFECANFEIEELEEVLWKWVAQSSEMNPSQEDRELLHNYVKNAKGSKEFCDGVRHASRSLPQLTGYDKKCSEWGEKLMAYALEYPFKQIQKRQIIEAVELALYWETTVNMERYEDAIKSNMLDPQTGELIARPCNAMHNTIIL